MIIQIGFSERDREIDQTVSLSSLCAFMRRTMNHPSLPQPSSQSGGCPSRKRPDKYDQEHEIGALYPLAIISHSASTWLNVK